MVASTQEIMQNKQIPWVHMKDAMVYLDLHRNAILAYIESGELAAYLVGKRYRFLQEDLDAFVQSRRTGRGQMVMNNGPEADDDDDDGGEG